MIKNICRRITAFQRDIKIVFTATDLLLNIGTFVLWNFNIENLTVYKMRIFFFFCGTTAQIAPRVPPCWGFLIVHTHTHTHTHRRTPLNKWSACHRHSYLRITQQTQGTNISVLSGMWTHNPSNQAFADLCLTSHSLHDQQMKTYFRQLELRGAVNLFYTQSVVQKFTHTIAKWTE